MASLDQEDKTDEMATSSDDRGSPEICGLFPPDLKPFDLYAVKTETISVHSADDKKNNFISGGTYIPNDHILLVDNYNEKLKVYKSKKLCFEQKTDRSHPCDAAYDQVNQVVLVTFPKPPYIVKYRITENALKPHGELNLTFSPFSISLLENELYIASVSGIFVLSLDGYQQRKIITYTTEIQLNPCAVVSARSRRFVYKDGDHVICCSLDGEEQYRKRVEGAKGLGFDYADNVYVCWGVSGKKKDRGNVHQISRTGTQSRDLIYTMTDIKMPFALVFHPLGTKFFISSADVKNFVVECYEFQRR